MPKGSLRNIRPGVYRGPNDDWPADRWRIGYELIYETGEKAYHLFDPGVTKQLSRALDGLVTLVEAEIAKAKDATVLSDYEKQLGFPVDKVGISEQVNVSLVQSQPDEEKPEEGLQIGG